MREVHFMHDTLAMVIGMTDFEKLGCDIEKFFRKMWEALATGITRMLSRVARRISNLQFERESTEKPAEST